MWKWETENDAKGIVVIAHNILEHTGRYAYVITMLRRNGYHVIMGDLPGQGQTSRANKGQIEDFNTYHEHFVEWIKLPMNINFLLCIRCWFRWINHIKSFRKSRPTN